MYLPAASRLNNCVAFDIRLQPSGARQHAAPPGGESNPADRESDSSPTGFPVEFQRPFQVANQASASSPLISRVSLLFPGVAVIVITDRLPEPRAVFTE